MRNASADAPFLFILVQPEGKSGTERIDASDLVLDFEFEDSEKKADQLKLQVDNWDLSNFDDPIWKPGNIIIATWGYPGKMAPARECVIQKVEGSIALTITAQSKAVLMNKETKSKTYENTRRSEIVHAIAKDYGYGDAQRDIEETETVYEGITQARATDAQFIKRLADAEGFEFYIDHTGFNWHARRLGKKPLRVLQYYLPPDVGDILSFNVENDVFAKPGKVTTKGRDPLTKKDVGGEGSNSTTDRDALNPLVEIIDPATGASSFRTNIANTDTKPTTETSAAQAKKEADGAYKRSVQTTVKLTLELVGDPLIAAKTVLDIRGISKRLSGLYYVNEAKHKINSSGYKLTIKCSTDGTNGHSENLLNEGGGASGVPATLEACKARFAQLQDEVKSLVTSKGGVWEGYGKPITPDSVAKDPEVQRKGTELTIVNDRCKNLAAAQSKAKQNEGKADDVDTGALTEKIDPSTGAISYHSEGGQPSKETK